MKTPFSQKLSILVVLFVGSLGFSVVFPLLPSMFLNPSLEYFPTELSLTARNILLGFALAMYPLGQFFGCPIFGRMSDTYGRRPILLITLFFTSLMYIVTGIGVWHKKIPVFFIGRFLTGLFEGNISIGAAVMADFSTEKLDKTRNFGWITTFSSTGWIFGPLLGGWLADTKIVPWFNYSTPFWASSILLGLALLLVYTFFRESLSEDERKKNLRIKELFSSFSRLVRIPLLRRIYTANGFFYLACFIFYTYFGTLLYRWFEATPREIGNLEAYISIFICLAPFTYTALAKKLPHAKTLAAAGVGLMISLMVMISFPDKRAIFITMIFPSYFIPLGMSFASLLVSDATTKKEQGEALGVNQAVMVGSECLVGLLGGFAIALWLYLPYFIGAIFCLVSAGFALSTTKFAQVD